MSFRHDARTVRDESAPSGRRVVAWRHCVTRYSPLGYEATMRHLAERFGPLDEPAVLVTALSALERSRDVWLAEVAAFAADRRIRKRLGRRAVSTAELAAYAHRGWPGGEAAGGPPTGSAGDRMSEDFRASYGLGRPRTAPVPYAPRRPAARPSRFGGVLLVLVAGGFGLALVATCSWLLGPPRPYWWGFAVTAPVVLAVLAWREWRTPAA